MFKELNKIMLTVNQYTFNRQVEITKKKSHGISTAENYKNSLHGFKSRSEMAEERSCTFEDRAEVMQSKEQRTKS